MLTRGEVARELLIFNSGKTALEYLLDASNAMPDIILLDINMPVMNGWELMEAMEQAGSDHLESIRIIMASASQNPDHVEKSCQYRFVKGYLSKPLRLKQLLDII